MRVISAGIFDAGGAARYREQLRVPDLSLGTYSIPAGADDPQSPHTEDEVYIVVSGHGTLWTPESSAEAVPGAVLFVPAGEEHRFVEVIEDLTVLVVFGPAVGSGEAGRE